MDMSWLSSKRPSGRRASVDVLASSPRLKPSRGRRGSTDILTSPVPDNKPSTPYLSKRRGSAMPTLSSPIGSGRRESNFSASKIAKFFSRGRSNSVSETLMSMTPDGQLPPAVKDSHGRYIYLCQVVIILPNGEKRLVTSENGRPVGEVVDPVAMETKLTSYRLHLASSRALLSLDTDIACFHGDEITINDTKDDDAYPDPDPRLAYVETLLRREKLYAACLQSIFELYAEPLRKFSSLSTEDHRVLFFNLEPILSFSAALCVKVTDAIQTWDPGTTRIGNLFSKQFWHHYDEYYHGYRIMRLLLKVKRNSDQEFSQFCQLRHGSAHHTLESLLMLPVQRVPDYDVFLSRLLEETEPSHPDYDDLAKAADRVRQMVKEREEEIQHVENETKMENIQERFPNDDLQLLDADTDKKSTKLSARRRSAGAVLLKPFAKKHHPSSEKNVGSPTQTLFQDSNDGSSPYTHFTGLCTRLYVIEGPVQLTAAYQAQDRYLFLFNDLLLIAKQRSNNVFKLKQRVRVCEIWLADYIEDVAEISRDPERSMVVGWPTANYVATFSSPQLMNIWKEKLCSQIEEEKEKEDKNCIIKIRYMDPDKFLSTNKSLTVGNMEEASSVVNRCIQEFHIVGHDSKDYQLWAKSPNKDESPYPLFGHEHPYSIRKNHERDWGNDSTSSHDSLRGLDLSYFTLQPAKKKPRDYSIEDPKRAKKIKRSPLHNIFKKTPKTSVPSGKLFGHPLSDVCVDDKLPEPIVTVLQVLFREGPYTTGPFRKPGSLKKLQDIKSKIDNGESFDIDDITVPIAASFLKDFLKNLPDCLLGCYLFDYWIAMELVSDNEQRINESRKFVESLPKMHQELLRHIICVLHTIVIEQATKEQGMDAYALSVCISQSLLWQGKTNSGQLSQTEAMGKVPGVVQFLIENAGQVFGEDCLRIFGDLPSEHGKPRQDSSTDSDSMHSLLSLAEHHGNGIRDNSSLDSLERDCYYPEMSIDSSPRLGKSHLSPTNLSRDSGLSDTQLFEDGTESEHSSIPPRRQGPMGRSYSQFEDNKPSADPGNLSSSHDGSLHFVHHGHSAPVPPPRKRRSGGMEYESAGHHKPHQSPGVPQLRTSASAQSVTDYRRQLRNINAMKRVSDDSTLGSLDEVYPEELLAPLNVEGYSSKESGILHKSDSGARLYLNDHLMAVQHPQSQRSLHNEHRRSAPPEMFDFPHGDLGHVPRIMRGDIHKLGGSLDLGMAPSNVPIPEHQVLSLEAPQRPLFTLASPDSPDDVAMISMQKPSFTKMEIPKSASQSHVSAGDRISMDTSEHPPSRPPGPTDYAKSKVHSDNIPGQFQSAMPSSSQVILRNKPSMSSEASERTNRSKLSRGQTIDSTVLRKGMTPSGEDKFPAKIPLRTSLYSLDEEGLLQSSSNPSKIHPSHPEGSSRNNTRQCRRSDSYNEAVPSVAERFRQKAIEKSASDTSLGDQFELRGPVRATARSRPEKPPSYEEALQRKSQVKTAHPMSVSQEDIKVQQQVSAKAKKLYEESLKRYEVAADTQTCRPPHRDSQSPVRDNQSGQKDTQKSEKSDNHQSKSRRHPPTYEQACQRAAQIRDNHEHKRTSSPSRHQPYPSHRHIERPDHQRLTDSHAQQTMVSSSRQRSESPKIEANSQRMKTESTLNKSDSNRLQAAAVRAQSDSPRRRVDSPSAHVTGPQRVESPSRRLTTGSPVMMAQHKPRQSSGSPMRSEKLSSDTTPKNSSCSSSFSSREGTPTRPELVSRTDSDRSRHQQRRDRQRSGSRSRERRPGQRFSDPKMSVTQAAVIAHVNRSKSDSHELMDKVGKFKMLSTYETNKENVSLDDLRKNNRNKNGSNRSTPERKPSDERIPLRNDDRYRRKSMPSSVLKAAVVSMQQDLEIEAKRERRPSIPSVRNRDWHKTLALQYENNDAFHTPEKDNSPVTNKVIEFGYVNNGMSESPQLDGEKPKRRWTPPVHPSKDLIYVTKDDIKQRSRSRHGSGGDRTSAGIIRNNSGSLKDRRTRTDGHRSQERPKSMYTDDIKKLQEEYNRSQVDQRNQNTSVSQHDLHRSSMEQNNNKNNGDISSEKESVKWSVAKLRNLYSEQKSQLPKSSSENRDNESGKSQKGSLFYSPGSQPPAPVSRHREYNAPWHSNNTPQKSSHHSAVRKVMERTNPNAEEAYV